MTCDDCFADGQTDGRETLLEMLRNPTPAMMEAVRTGSFRDLPDDELCRVRLAALAAAMEQPR